MIYNKTVNEDFDFNNVKKQHIEDDYDIRHGIRLANKMSPDIVLNKVFHVTWNDINDLYSVPVNDILHYDKDKEYGNVLTIGNISKSVSGMSLRVDQYQLYVNHFIYYHIYFDERVSYTDNNPFINRSKNPYINYVIDFIKYYFSDFDFNSLGCCLIEFYISPDNGIIYIYKTRLTWYKEKSFVMLPHMIFYTGEVLYNKEKLSMNEDFDFNKVNKHHIEDDYEISPENIRLLNSNISFNLILNKKFHFTADIKKCFNTCNNYKDISNDDIHILNAGKYGKIMCIDKVINKVSEDLLIINTGIVKLLELLEFKKYIKYSVDTLISKNIIYSHIDYISDFIKDYYKIDINNDSVIEYLVSPDNGIIIITCAKFRIPQNNNIEYFSLPTTFLYTGEVLYNKNELLSMNEDFDFNKVKKHHIEDDYKIDYNTIRTSISPEIKMSALLQSQFNILPPQQYIQTYIKDIGCVLSKKDKNLHTCDIKKNLTIYNKHGLTGIKRPFNVTYQLIIENSCFNYGYYDDHNIFFDDNFDQYTDDPIKLTLISVLEYLFDMPIEDIKNTNAIPTIEYYVSPDNGILLISLIECRAIEPTYRWIKTGGFFVYTGYVNYNLI